MHQLTKLILALLAAGSWFGCTSPPTAGQLVGDELSFPYQAIVLHDEAPVHSGPGNVHYATSKLDQGATVEVYRHDPGGWCAIRPPSSNFSLVPESAVRILQDGVGEITEDGTQAWVGTQLGPVAQPLWQIKLKSGEPIEILGEASWPDPAGHSSIWLQIAPPAGEFRWVRISDLQLPPAMVNVVSAEGSEIQRMADRQIADHGSDLSQVQPANYQTNAPSIIPTRGEPAVDLNSINQGWRQSSRPIDRSQITEANPNKASDHFETSSIAAAPAEQGSASLLTFPNSPPAERLASTKIDPRFDLEQLRGAPSTYKADLIQTPPMAPLTGSGLDSQSLTPRITQLELKLNSEMIKEPNHWRLIDLQTAAQSISEGTNDLNERFQAQRLLAKLENCRKIRSNYLAAFNTNGSQNPNAPSAASTSVDEFSLDTMYDAHGWLNELVRDGGTKRSTYVLQDEHGKITHHISPQPGMNLSSYLKTKVGIIGKRGYHTELKLDHVTAERVIELKRR